MSRRDHRIIRLWRIGWRRTALITKALIFSICLGFTFWMLMDNWQTVQVEAIFHQHLMNGIKVQARRDRSLLDRYFRAQEHTIKLLTYMTPFEIYIRSMEPASTELANTELANTEPASTELASTEPGNTELAATDYPLDILEWPPHKRPPWLLPRSVLHSMAYAPYIMILDSNRQVREIYHQDEGLPHLPKKFLQLSLPELLALDGHNSISLEEDGAIYLITSIAFMKESRIPQAFLAFVAPMNDEFLAIFHAHAEKDDVVVFVNSDTDQIFASSRPDAVASGSDLTSLQERYIVAGKKFLDYGFSSNVLINFASLVPKEKVREVSDAILWAERKQRIIGYALLTILFLLVVFAVAKSLQRFTQKMVDISTNQLKMVDISTNQLNIPPKTVQGGDQLLMMEEQFRLMTDEILQSRQREITRREELQLTNDALSQSLVMIKRAQSQLTETEKMASLGGLVAGVAHEINTPVGTGVTAASFLEGRSRECADSLAAGTLRKSELDLFFVDVVESSQMILSNLLRAAELIRSFKQVAVDRTNEERRLFRVNEYIHHVLRSLHSRLKKTNISVQVKCPEILEIDSFPGVFSQIITNLVINSLTHGFAEGETGEITLDVKVDERGTVFCYADNGLGMEEQVRVQMFEPFFTTARNRGGSGLGMHIVFNLVTQTLKGSIQCASSLGQGCLFTIIVPPDQLGTGR